MRIKNKKNSRAVLRRITARECLFNSGLNNMHPNMTDIAGLQKIRYLCIRHIPKIH